MADKNKDVGFFGPFLPKFGDFIMDGIFGDEGKTTGEQILGFDSYDYTGLPKDSTYKDYITELQKSRDLSLYSRYDGDKQEAIKKEGDEIRADINRLFPKRKDNDARLQKEKEAFMDSPKGRMQTMFNDADKRDAILGGIADAMLETRVGADAYGNRFARAQKNGRDNLKIAEATDIARQKAQLDAMKTMAETTKLVDPRQYLTNAQTEADSFVKAQIRAGKIKPENYDTAYASMLKQIAVKDLTSAKASSISTLFTYAQALQGSDPVTAGILMDAIKSNAIYLAGDGASGEVVTETIDATEYNKKK